MFEQITFGIAENRSIGVVVAAYSGKLSQIFLWDTENDYFTPGQFLKGRAFLLDISPDAKYIVYRAVQSHKKAQSYVAISHPPYFTAVGFFPHYPIDRTYAKFVNNKTLRLYSVRKDISYVNGFDSIQERIEPDCPLDIVRPSYNEINFDNVNEFVCDERNDRLIKREKMSLYIRKKNDSQWTKLKSFDNLGFQEMEPPAWALKW